MDGLSAGVAVISSTYLVAIYSLRGGWDNVLVLSLLTGALAAFLIFNFQPARIFMGDAGSLFIGFLLAGVSLLEVTHLSGLSSFLFIPILVLAVPILDTVFVSVTRRLRGQPISQGGTDHTSHRLVRLGINERRAVLVLYGLSAVSGGIAFAIHYISPLNAVVLVALWGLFLLLFAVHLFEPGAPGDATSLYPVLNRDALVILLDPIVLSLSYYLAFFFRFGEVTGDHWSAFVRSWPVLLAIKSVCLLSCGVYRRSWWRGGRQDLYRLLQASLLGDVLSVIVFVGAYRFYGYSRIVFALDGVVSSLLLIATRGSFQLFRDFVETVHGPAGGERRAAILGTDHSAQVAVPLLKDYRAFCVGLIQTQREAGLARHIWGVPVLGHVDDLSQLIERHRIQDVVLPGSEPGGLVESVIALAAQRNVRVLRLGLYEEPGSLRARAASAAVQDVNGAQ
jgi:UDP-GlcNAc:undecaprenyl-phosphate GlcNAc-1-phosphate transferase